MIRPPMTSSYFKSVIILPALDVFLAFPQSTSATIFHPCTIPIPSSSDPPSTDSGVVVDFIAKQQPQEDKSTHQDINSHRSHHQFTDTPNDPHTLLRISGLVIWVGYLISINILEVMVESCITLEI